MKHLRKFDSVSAMTTAISSSEITIVGMALDNNVPVVGRKSVTTPPAPVVDPTIPFYIEDISGSNNTVKITRYDSSQPALKIYKSTDGSTWESMGTTSVTSVITATIPANGKLYLRCSTTTWSNSSSAAYCNSINTTGNCNVGGNIMSLLYGSKFTGNETTFPSGSTNTFNSLFRNKTNIVNAANLLLPATTLTDYCYSCMFQGCTGLTTAPATLPATTLARSCYANMFYQCSSLTIVPAILPATTLASYCYQQMFGYCTSLTTAPALPATTLAEACYTNMFYGCTSLTSAPALPATTLANQCYLYMFNGCTSLTTAPVLPATTLVTRCYYYMFTGCSNLNYIQCLATDISASYCTSYWVQNVAATGTFVKDPNMSDWETGNNGIPSGWTVEDATA